MKAVELANALTPSPTMPSLSTTTENSRTLTSIVKINTRLANELVGMMLSPIDNTTPKESNFT
jgi:hypothetical protein